jgi:hypothetical protein
MCICVRICAGVYMYAFMCVCLRVCMCVYVCVIVCVCVQISITRMAPRSVFSVFNGNVVSLKTVTLEQRCVIQTKHTLHALHLPAAVPPAAAASAAPPLHC